MDEQEFGRWCMNTPGGEWHNNRGQQYCELGMAMGLHLKDGNLRTREGTKAPDYSSISGSTLGIEVDAPIEEFEQDGSTLTNGSVKIGNIGRNTWTIG